MTLSKDSQGADNRTYVGCMYIIPVQPSLSLKAIESGWVFAYVLLVSFASFKYNLSLPSHRSGLLLFVFFEISRRKNGFQTQIKMTSPKLMG